MRTNGSDSPAADLTKREMAAIHAMAGLLAATDGAEAPDTKHLAFIAVAAADALFDELKEE